ncbi:MAG: hypothetical protein IPH57_17990 [Saprospiraceae bacterium]|nr:hypothetical protein [Saprospiraceae bacterium]
MESLWINMLMKGQQHRKYKRFCGFNLFTEYGSPIEIVNRFGSKAKYQEAVKELEIELYKTTDKKRVYVIKLDRGMTGLFNEIVKKMTNIRFLHHPLGW